MGMKHIIKLGTDVASFAIFDPKALPAGIDSRLREGTSETLEELGKEELVFIHDTGSDGSFTLQLYVEEPLPERIVKRCNMPKAAPLLIVPSGQLVVCGAEFVSANPLNEDNGGLGRYPNMGGECKVPSGKYALELAGLDWPEREVRKRMVEKLGESSVNAYEAFTTVLGLVLFVLVIAALVALLATISPKGRREFGVSGLAWLWGFLTVAGLVWLAGVWWTKGFEQSPARREVLSEFPDYVVQMRKTV